MYNLNVAPLLGHSLFYPKPDRNPITIYPTSKEAQSIYKHPAYNTVSALRLMHIFQQNELLKIYWKGRTKINHGEKILGISREMKPIQDKN